MLRGHKASPTDHRLTSVTLLPDANQFKAAFESAQQANSGESVSTSAAASGTEGAEVGETEAPPADGGKVGDAEDKTEKEVEKTAASEEQKVDAPAAEDKKEAAEEKKD